MSKSIKIGAAVFFLFCIVASVHAASVLDRIVAVVNDEAITWSELNEAMLQELGGRLKGLDEAEKIKALKENEASFLYAMIEVKLQLQEARRLGIRASAEDVDNAVEDIKKRNSLGDEAFLKAIEAEGISIDKLRVKLSEQILLNRLIDREIRGKTVVSPEEIKKLEEESGGLYRIRQIFFKPGGYQKAEAVYKRLLAGEDFVELAKTNSEDVTAKSGGDLGLIKRKTLAAEFQNALAEMKQGDISKPFKTSRGVHIIKLEQAVSMKEALLDERFQKRYMDWLRELKEKAHIDVKL